MTQPAPAQPLADDDTDLATGLTGRDLRKAALAVCAASTDVDDARDLLEALGLLDQLRGTDRLAS